MSASRQYHLISADRKPEFIQRGYKGRYFFPHRVYFHTKPQPEQLAFARQFWSLPETGRLQSLALFAEPPIVDEFNEQIYFDRRIMTHRGHLGRPGLVATACLYIDGDKLYTDEHLSDLVTRCGFAGEDRNKIKRRFGGWHQALLNSILHYANAHSLKEIHIPTSDRIQRLYIQRELDMAAIERLYDRDTNMRFNAEEEEGCWVIDVQQNRDRLIPMRLENEPTTLPQRSICLFHDVTPDSAHHLESALEAENQLNIRSTYCVPGTMLKQIREPIEKDDHELAFRSYDGKAYKQIDYGPGEEPPPTPTFANKLRQLIKLKPTIDMVDLCRDIDFYLTGMRATDIDVRAGLTHDPLRALHFDWVLDPRSIPNAQPLDDRGLMVFSINAELAANSTISQGNPDWLAALLELIAGLPFVTISLPLSSAESWLPVLPELTEALRMQGSLSTPQDYVDHFHLDQSI